MLRSLFKRSAAPRIEDCEFYHSIDLPNETVHGFWDIRGRFDQYVGHYPLKHKAVLDVGTAGGFIAFEAEKAGAKRVTALDIQNADTVERVPFQSSPFLTDRRTWQRDVETGHLTRQANGFTYAHTKLGSNVERIFAPVERLASLNRRFDVVIAGATLEHLHNPVGAIGQCCHVADEAVIIAFTPVIDTDDMRAEPLNGWNVPSIDYSWWSLSRGLYRKVFANMGFETEFVPSEAVYNPNRHNDVSEPTIWKRHTIIARRVRPSGP